MFARCIWLRMCVAALFQEAVLGTITISYKDANDQQKTATLTQENQIADGTSGSIWSAVLDEQYNVAIKIANSKGNETLFWNEWHSYAVLEAVVSPGNKISEAEKEGIIPVYFIGEVDEAPFPFLKGKLAIVMKRLGQDMYTYIAEKTNNGMEISTLEWMQISSAMLRPLKYIHSKGMLHGDIKPENYIYDSVETKDAKGYRNTKLFLGDFGFSQVSNDGKFSITASGACGTLLYISPNIHDISCQFSVNPSFEPTARPQQEDDVFAAAAAMFHIKYICLPWTEIVDEYYIWEQIKEKLKRGEKVPPYSKEPTLEMSSCLDLICTRKKRFLQTVTDKYYKGDEIARDILIRMLKLSLLLPNVSGNTKSKETLETIFNSWEDAYKALSSLPARLLPIRGTDEQNSLLEKKLKRSRWFCL